MSGSTALTHSLSITFLPVVPGSSDFNISDLVKPPPTLINLLATHYLDTHMKQSNLDGLLHCST